MIFEKLSRSVGDAEAFKDGHAVTETSVAEGDGETGGEYLAIPRPRPRESFWNVGHGCGVGFIGWLNLW